VALLVLLQLSGENVSAHAVVLPEKIRDAASSALEVLYSQSSCPAASPHLSTPRLHCRTRQLATPCCHGAGY
jgi:hypothetical protein